ncbi:GNAT family N-acetyltransferase [Sphingobium sp. SCG-1]|uniref:GNAT family N-acetyltransferase n=1 Tax=Sphingobium sp. SCG-1 TaxID=2072936 RepID=UPI000CD67693|nr:N-acetyltransferase [Sphingobium sp. SCG-1]AUW60293.1 GNAT family N-acetyltransferase [Sphingobium sp. SCG-1]
MLSLIGGATFLETFGDSIDAANLLAHAQGPHGVAYYNTLLADTANTRCWLAELPVTAAPIGYQVLTTSDLTQALPDDIELKRIYIFSRYHGGGLAHRLVDIAIDAARSMGKRRLLLGVYSENHRAIAFYRKAGFEMIGEREFVVGQQLFYDKVMARTL